VVSRETDGSSFEPTAKNSRYVPYDPFPFVSYNIKYTYMVRRMIGFFVGFVYSWGKEMYNDFAKQKQKQKLIQINHKRKGGVVGEP
jgi:hypothetical protein